MVSRRLYRVPVMDADEVLHIATQTDVVRLIHEHIGLFPNAQKRIKELGFAFKPVITVTPDISAFEAYKKLATEKKGGLAVVKFNGEVVGNISASDLKRIRGDLAGIRSLRLPVGEYLGLNEADNPLCITGETTLEEVIAKLVMGHRHRVFVVDPGTKVPLGIVSLTDIIEFASK